MRDGLDAGSFGVSDAALADLGKVADVPTKETARLARALLWARNGRGAIAKDVIEDLAESALTPAVKKRAAELMAAK